MRGTGSECFEAKLNHDERFSWPGSNLRKHVTALQRLLLRASLAALAALAHELRLDAGYLQRDVLDEDLELPAGASVAGEGRPVSSGPKGVAALAAASHSAMRLWCYTRGGQPTGWHVDNTLLTVAPPGSAPGLRVRTLSGRTFFAEEETRPTPSALPAPCTMH